MKNKLLIFYIYINDKVKLEDLDIHFRCLEYFKDTWDEVLFAIIANDYENILVYQTKIHLSNIFYNKNITFTYDNCYDFIKQKLYDYDGYVMYASTKLTNETNKYKNYYIVIGYYLCAILNKENSFDLYLNNDKLIYLSFYFYNIRKNIYSELSYYWFDNKQLLSYLDSHNIDIKEDELDTWYYKYINNDNISFYENYIFRNNYKLNFYYDLISGDMPLLCSYHTYEKIFNTFEILI